VCAFVYQVANNRIATAAKAASGFPFAENQKSIASDLQQAEKENGMIYHVHVPQASTLGPIDKAVVAKPVPVSGPMSTSSTGECRAYVLQAPYCPMTCFVDRRDSHFLSSFRLDTSVVGTVFKRLHGQVPDYASILSTRRWCLCGLWKCLRDAAPRYLADLCVPAHSVHGRQQLRSKASGTLLVPHARTATGQHSFAINGP